MNTAPSRPKIDYYFSAISSFAYLGHWAFQDMVSRLDLDVTYRPVQLGRVFGNSGGIPVGERHPARIRYRYLELKRWAEYRGLEMKVQPTHFPTNPALADKAIIAVQQQGRNPAELIGAIMQKIWIADVNIAERDVIADCLSDCGEDAQAILALAEDAAIDALYTDNTDKGIALDIIGSPCITYRDEPFWGQDRFDLVEHVITNDRPPLSCAP